MPTVIDKLPEVKRQKVVAALLAGEPLRKVAVMAGVSHTQVGEYRKRVILPTLQAAQKLNAVQIVADSKDLSTVSPEVLTRAAIAVEPFRNRIATHQATIDEGIAFAKVKQDTRGLAALIRTDLSGLELDARLTGLLDGPGHVTVNNLSVLMMPKCDPEPEVIDVHAEAVTDGDANEPK